MSIHLERGKSEINGFGIFSKDKIVKGKKYYPAPLDLIYSHPQKNCARISEGKYLFDNKILNWVNHSCNPNSKLEVNKDKVFLTAIKNIYPGKEITVNYNKTEPLGIKVKCTCKSKNCKGYFNKF